MFVTNTVAIAEADEITAAVEAGGGAGEIRIYDGATPADADAGLGGATLLVIIPLNVPSFPTATDAAPGAVLTLDVIPIPEADAIASASGSPALFARLTNSSGTPVVAQFTVGTAAAEIIINTLAIVINAAVQITAGTITVPED